MFSRKQNGRMTNHMRAGLKTHVDDDLEEEPDMEGLGEVDLVDLRSG